VLIKIVADSKYKTTQLNVNWVTRSLRVHLFRLFTVVVLRLRRQSSKEIVTCDWERKRRKV